MKNTKTPNAQQPPKLTRKQKDDMLAAHLPGLLHYHQKMLADGLRNGLIFEAMKRHITSDTNFLDVGAGTGVWAILAAKLGAKRVVAIEIEEGLIPVLYKHAQENGVAHKIEIIHGHSDHAKIKGKFDVIVSELFGSDALSQRTVDSFVSIRKRFLAPNGVLIPQKLRMLVAPAKLSNPLSKIPAKLPLSCNFLKSIKMNYGIMLSVEERERVTFLAKPELLAELDFRTVETAPSLASLSATWKMRNISKVNSFVTFNESVFDDGIKMDAFGSQSWGASAYEFEPFAIKAGELRFEQSMDAKHGSWSASVPTEPTAKKQSFSSVFAFTRIRMAQKMTPHKKVKPPKTTKGAKE